MQQTTTDKEQQMTSSEQLREKAAQHDRDAAESFARCDTDGFLSQWASGLNAQRDRLQADIQDAGGIATFGRYQLVSLHDGQPVNAKIINGKFGQCWAFMNDNGSFTGKFISAHPKRKATMAKKGYREDEVEFVAEATADLRGANATSVRAIVRPKDSKVEYDRVIGLGDQR